jgi:ABC-2 type transport system ATP-binding protein
MGQKKVRRDFGGIERLMRNPSRGGTMIEIEDLSKAFQVARKKEGTWFGRTWETVRALEEMTFSVGRGEIVGYIGPNGAGKSTTIKIMSGILVPTSGRCEIMGLTPWKDRVAHVRNIGVVFGQRTQLWWDLPVSDSFLLLKDIYRIPENSFREQLEWLVEALGLEALLTFPVRQLSLGQRMRCELAAALLHRPSILFLDEPTIGLDAVSKIAVRKIVKKVCAEQQVTVLLTTHDMNDIEALAERVILIGKGRKLYDGGLNALKARYVHTKRITAEYAGEGEALLSALESAGCRLISSDAGRLTMDVDLEVTGVAEVIQRLTSHLNISDISVDAPAIDDVIVRLYEELAL